MSEVNERIEEIIEGFSGGKTEFARATGIDFKTQRNYVNGRNKPSFDFLVNLHALGEDVLYVLTGVRSVPEGFVRIPKMSAIGSMGSGIDGSLAHDNVLEYITVSKDWIVRTMGPYSKADNLRIIHGRGDSMAPTFSDNTPLLVDIGVTDFQQDAIYLFQLFGEVYIKRLQRKPRGGYKAISDNKYYESFEILEPDDFRVIALVVGAWNFSKF
ncbi:MAG: XRE family transcriptional regulator [Cardiobacterium hominis]